MKNRLLAFIGLSLWLCLSICTVLAQENIPSSQPPKTQIPWKTAEYTMLAREMPLFDALTAFGTAQGLSVVISKDVVGALSGDFRKLPPQEFLDRVTMLHNLTWFYDGTALYIYAGGEIQTLLLDLKYMKAGEVRAMLKELGVEDERFPLKTTSNDELVMVSGPPRYVLLISELVAKADKLREKRAFSEVETRIFPLKHTWADDVSLTSGGSEGGGSIKGVAKMLEDMMNPSGTTPTKDKALAQDGEHPEDDPLISTLDRGIRPIIKAENRLNAVVVRDVSWRMPLYEKLIAQLDVPQKLVEIAVTTLELSKNDALDWQLSLAIRGGSSNMDGAAGQNAANLFEPLDIAGKGLAGALGYIGEHVSVSASLSALRQKGKARSISRTSLLMMNNMGASITDTQSYHAKVVGSEVASLEEVTAGTKLQVKPRIIKSEEPGKPTRFWMTVSLQDGGFEAVSVDSMPLTRSSTVTTQASVDEGECILLAGYMRDIEEDVGWGIPYLRDIPFIGWLFGGVGKKKETVQRMFILTPYVVELDTEDLARVQATRHRDIQREEQLEDDKKEDDALREIRDMEREDRDDARREKYSDMRDERKEEIKLRRDKRQAAREENRELWMRDIEARREMWEEWQRQKAAEKEKKN